MNVKDLPCGSSSCFFSSPPKRFHSTVGIVLLLTENILEFCSAFLPHSKPPPHSFYTVAPHELYVGVCSIISPTVDAGRLCSILPSMPVPLRIFPLAHLEQRSCAILLQLHSDFPEQLLYYYVMLLTGAKSSL